MISSPASDKTVVPNVHKEMMVKTEQLKGNKGLNETAVGRAEAEIDYLAELGDQYIANRSLEQSELDNALQDCLSQGEQHTQSMFPSNGDDLAAGVTDQLRKKNPQELVELVSSLKDDLAQRENRIKELESMSASKDDDNKSDLVTKVNELTKEIAKLQQSAQAQQEIFQKKCDHLSKLVVSLHLNQWQYEDAISLHQAQDSENKAKIMLLQDQVNAKETMIKEEREKIENLLAEKQEKLRELEIENGNLSKQVTELTTSATAEKCAELQKKCDDLSNRVVTMHLQQWKYEDTMQQDQKNQKELGELVSSLKGDLAERETRIKELESVLSSEDDDLVTKLNELTKENVKLQQSAQAKQEVFQKKCDHLSKRVVSLHLNQWQYEDAISMHQAQDSEKEAKIMLLQDQEEKIAKILEGKVKSLLETQEKLRELERDGDNLLKQIAELTIEAMEANKNKEMAEQELSEAAKKHDGLLNLVMGLYQKQEESEQKISALEQSHENQRAQFSEKKMQDQVLLETQTKLRESEIENENLSKQVTELTTAVKDSNESKEKADQELSEAVKKRDVFFILGTRLYQEQEESKKEISALKQSNENLRAQLSEKDQVNAIFQKDKEKMENLLLETQTKLRESEIENENLSKQLTELITAVKDSNESKEKAEQELSEAVKKRNCLFNLVMGLYQKLEESEKKISALKRSYENQRAQLSEKEIMLQDQMQVNANDGIFHEKMEKMLEEKDNLLQETQEKIRELKKEKESLFERITELTTEVMKASESQKKVKEELIETTKNCEDQLMSFNSKQLEYEKEISALKRLTEDLQAQVSEKEGMLKTLQVNTSALNEFLLEKQKKIRELTTEVTDANKRKENAESELNETAKKCAENRQRMSTILSEKENAIMMLQAQIKRKSRELDEEKNMPLPIQEQGEQAEAEHDIFEG